MGQGPARAKALWWGQASLSGSCLGLLGVGGQAGGARRRCVDAVMEGWHSEQRGYDLISPPGLWVVAARGEEDWKRRTVESAESRAWYTVGTQ